MKQIHLIVLFCVMLNTVNAQTISPLQTNEYCPNTEYTFTVSVPNTYSSMIGVGSCYVTQLPASPVGSTFTFKGKFGDANQNQSFRIYYTDNTFFDFDFKKINSLFYGSCTPVAAPANINAPICQAANIPISFSNIQWLTKFESPQFCFGSITTYEYLLPSGWKLGTITSNGSTWLPAGNSVTVTSNLLGGGQIAVRPVNSCNSSLQKNQPPSYINITRPNSPVLQVNGASIVTLYCGDASAKTFTVQNAAACITSYEWVTANKGWFDVNSNPITANIITTTPSITIYPSCNSSNPAKDIEVLMKVGTEVLSSKVVVTFSTSPPPLTITGPGEFCTSASYSVPVSTACGASVVWSLEPLNNFPTPATLSCTNCQTTTLTKYNGGTALLRATVTFPNCNSTGIYEKYIGIGTPVFRGWYNSPTNSQEPLNPWTRANMTATNIACYGIYITTSTDITANTNVVWQAGGIPSGMQWYQIGNNLRFYFADINQVAFFSVAITNSCGTTDIRYRFTSVGDNCSGGNPLRVQLSPNPATNSVKVTLTDKLDLNKQKEIIEIHLIDKMGNIKQKWNYGKISGNKSRQVNVSSLSADLYTIMVFDGMTWTTEKFIKQ